MHRGLSSIGRGGGGFSGAVVPLEVSEPVVERHPQETVDETRQEPTPVSPMLGTILGRLSVLQPTSKKLKKRLSTVIGELSPLLDEADALEAACIDEWKADLKQQWEAVRKAGRKQHELCGRLTQEAAQAELALHQVAAKQESALTELSELNFLEQRGQAVPRWANDAELDAWEARVNQAKAKVIKTNESAVIALQNRNAAVAKSERAHQELSRLGTEEVRLRNALLGRPFRDAEFGLLSAPAGFSRD